MSDYMKVESEITDPKSKVTYQIGKMLGHGGFATCLEFKNTKTDEIFAGKIVAKKALTKPYHKKQIAEEIRIHTAMSHQYIVTLHSYFEDDYNIYIISELCRNRSLMEMHLVRKTLTIAEVRYFMRQIVLACKYMHENKVIHRDLKPSNLFLNDEMEIKVGDFGLATQLSFDGELLTISCGTPDYIAPEILKKTGYSYEVDIWSLGCIMYTLLVGSPPFLANLRKTTYDKIRNNKYHIPAGLDPCASKLIKKLLHPEPEFRPCASVILKDDFFQNCYIPSQIPVSCLFMQPSQEVFETQSMEIDELIASGTDEKNEDKKLNEEKTKPVVSRQSSKEENPAKPKKRKLTYLDMVKEAIEVVGIPHKGASVQAIKKYIYDKKEKTRDFFIKKALITGVERGIFQKTNKIDRGGATGSFALVKLQKTRESCQNNKRKI